MDNNPYVFLDVANLIEGEGTSFDEARQALEEHVPLIERCCLKLWGALPTQRFAFSLTTIDERLHELLRQAGYQVEVAPALRTDTMLIEECSKRDDYLLRREVKRQRQDGMREALIVSGDRDFESLALELSVFGTQFHYVQRQKQQTQRTMNMERHRCLKDFAGPLSNDLEQQLHTQQKRGIGTLSEPTLGPRLCLSFKGQEVEEIELFSGFTIGRTSGSSGAVDLCLAQYDRQKDYSRQLAQVHQLGEAWVLSRIPQDEKKLKRQPILYSAGNTNVSETQSIRSGENIVLQPGDLFNFERCDLQVTFKS